MAQFEKNKPSVQAPPKEQPTPSSTDAGKAEKGIPTSGDDSEARIPGVGGATGTGTDRDWKKEAG